MTTANEEIKRILAGLNAEERARVQPRLTRVLTHRNAVRRFPTPGHLGQLFRPGWLQTPMLDAIDEAIMSADRGEQLRWVINTPPQEGKTSRLQDGGAYFLLRRPWLRIAYASYEQGVAAQSGLAIRQMLETHGSGYQGANQDPDREDVLGLMLDPNRGMQTNWALADVPGRKGMRPGGVLSVGIGSSFTGRPADVLIIDDPLKDAKAADSPVIRKTVVDWFQSVASTRLAPNAIVMIIQCMTGDTPVLRPDGSETPLRDIRVGDQITTYENGALSVSTVRNWANQGPDNVYAIKMKSGATVRANARHPFLTIDDKGCETWQRVADLRPGAYILRAGAEGGLGSPAQSTNVTNKSAARDSVNPTTTALDGRLDTDAEAPNRTGVPTFVTGTASSPRTTTAFLPNREECAPSADVTRSTQELQPTGAASCALTTVTTLMPCGDSSATTATSWSEGGAQRSDSGRELTTWTVTPDEIIEIVPAGVEDVFDIQVDRTENFIANGLVSHNTRWHEEDLSGWILTGDASRTYPRYRHLNIQAQAEAADEQGACDCATCLGRPDVLGREPGEYLLSARGRTVADWEQTKIDVGTRWWFALYQGRPAPPEGGIFQRAWFDRNRVGEHPELVYTMTMVDPADNQGDGDEAGIITGGIDAEGQVYILADNSGHYTVARWVRVAIYAALRHGSHQIGYERSLSGLKRAVAAEWKAIRRQAITLVEQSPAALWGQEGPWREDWPEEPDMVVLDAAVAVLAHPEDNELERKIIWKDLAELWPRVPDVMNMTTLGPPIRPVKAEGTKAFRASMVSPVYEQDRVHHVGHHVKLEHQMATWLETQDSPDRMDALVHLVTELSKKGTGSRIGTPTGNRMPAHQPRVPQIMRSTRR